MLQALYFDNLIHLLKEKFQQVKDCRSAVNSTKPLADALMSGLALFALKDRSLLQPAYRQAGLLSALKNGAAIYEASLR